MIRPTRFAGVLAAAISAATFGVSDVTGASAGQKTFQQTFPLASRVCAQVAQGAGPKRLRRFAALVLTDCNTLQSGFNAARAAVLAAEASISSQLAAERAVERPLIDASCAGHPRHPLLCRQVRRRERRVIERLKRARVRSAHRYYRTIEADRLAFWRAIRALPGGRALREDKPIPDLSD